MIEEGQRAAVAEKLWVEQPSLVWFGFFVLMIYQPSWVI